VKKKFGIFLRSKKMRIMEEPKCKHIVEVVIVVINLVLVNLEVIVRDSLALLGLIAAIRGYALLAS
jgi:hypothetical protein